MTWSDFLTKENSTQHVIDVYTNPNVLTLETVTGTDDILLNKRIDFLIYPNPAKNKINLLNLNYQRLEISDLQGNIVFSTSIPVKSIQTENFKNGIYILRFEADNAVIQEKLVICK